MESWVDGRMGRSQVRMSATRKYSFNEPRSDDTSLEALMKTQFKLRRSGTTLDR